MATHSFEWKSGPTATPQAVPDHSDVIYKEAASQTVDAGYPLTIDASDSSSGAVVFKAADAVGDDFRFLSTGNGANAAAAVDMEDPTGKSGLPILVRNGDIFSVTCSASGAGAATTVDMLGLQYGWIASTDDATKAVLDTDNTTEKVWLVVGYDSRDALGTTGGRLLVMYCGAGFVVAAAQQT